MQYGWILGKYLFGMVLFVAASAAADWAEFQGPNRDGKSPETGLARSWPDVGPPTLWSFELSTGYAGAAVRDGEVYVLDRVDDARDVLRCLSLETGEELWNYTYDAPGKVGHSGSRTTPTVTEAHVFTVGMMGHMYCFDRRTRERVWHRHLPTKYPTASKPRWGYSQAPLLYKDMVIIAPQSPDAFVVALEQSTGKEVWASKGFGLFGYSVPVIRTLAGVEQVLMIAARAKDYSAAGAAGGISPEDGRVLWTYDGWQTYLPVPFPTVLPNDRVFLTAGYEAGSAMIQVKRDGDDFTVKELYLTDACGSQLHQPLLHDNYLYMNSNSNKRSDGMLCLALDGTMRWRTADGDSLPNFERGNLIMADGMIIGLDGKTGMLHLVEPSPEGYRELASAKVFNGAKMWSPMALTGGKLVLRSQETLKCLDLRAPSKVADAAQL
jgi:outer membrane protein assembly factor BamB